MINLPLIPDTNPKEAFCYLDYLVVDDIVAVRHVLIKILRRLGVKGRIDTAGDGLEAWGMVQDYSYDFIICDIHMPRMNGLKFKRLLRASPHFRETPFLMISGEVSEKTMALAMETEFDGYLYKPFRSAALEQWLLKLAGGLSACVLLSTYHR